MDQERRKAYESSNITSVVEKKSFRNRSKEKGEKGKKLFTDLNGSGN